ncbi:MAG TPA: low molecular weight protein-tyrosine-phosphatase [Polyangiaceae bacterium LLY-WYZ-15_(1-7)]|nr:phosphotyrosine protein phosphatase [Sandaracinus sp.]HJK90588.1 low molecular weight protein-tyrosine-phosphatase [Polyangiaceae bacterium LLY-WYZ-15_(1-7)]HJL04305.1 low molecular weight protein-tyrosine-phosphatase [Polyangiaceae bacterium LLY-WYZ-15_(1-7)]HJL10524.1 low molecular weight protein-tyrosine-phosphatase [Polyangiaceae bacterium LLY-WYZ-15_(1-7)]HJL23747.1 low molecular weight protein-tyrosine-phosphatase [Polyangiaceae bacterium LLY-WYZ-15_(1-7)]
MTAPKVSICFVCLGNICRSPTAEGVMRHLLAEEGLSELIALDSAGTGGWHVGEKPDPRARAAAARRGITVDGAGRQFQRGDFARFDYVVAMDGSNLRNLRKLASRDEHEEKLSLLRDHDPGSPADAEVPDPYYGGEGGFETVLDIVEAGCRGLLERVRREHGL